MSEFRLSSGYMTIEQRISLRWTHFIALGVAMIGWGVVPIEAGNRVLIADGKVSIEIPSGWEESELNADKVLAGYATQDNRTSVFLQALDPASNGTMQDLINGIIENFDKTFEMTKVDESKTGQVEGPEKKWPAVFSVAEGKFTKEEKEFEMKFYILIFDTGTGLYFLQASTTMPVRESRERQIYELIRSIIAKS